MRAKLKSYWDRVVAGINKWRDERRDADALLMLPLTPTYDPEKHGTYFRAIRKALKNRKTGVRNIALTGSYGVGKSSVLGHVTTKYRRHVISVSLSTLGLADEPVADNDAARAAATPTNRIQKEIVKQLLYSQDPVKMPGSRYHRNTRFRFGRELGLGALVAFLVTVISYLAGWTHTIGLLVPWPKGLEQLTNVVVFVVVTFIVVSIRAIFHNKIQIDKIGAGSATISLSAKSQTYFDEYLDEIVYFFEVIKRKNIVIFEDIDRFEDPHIFETLRSLNTILNGAKQLRGRRVSFIYAIKDSIFDELGARATRAADGVVVDDAAAAEMARANRTKFFDIVIPVVPFITHRSARDLLNQTMKDVDHKLSRGLVDLVARHVPDMRLIKNIHNEFLVFKERIIDQGSLDLDEDQLFAMVTYKSAHLSDFELIKFGTSDLDNLYKDFRKLVLESTRTENRTIASNRQAIETVTIRQDQAARMGEALIAHIDRSLRAIGSPRVTSRQLDGQAVDDEEMKSAAFWEKLAANNGNVQINYYDPTYGRNLIMTFTRPDIAGALGQPVETAAWSKSEQDRLNGEIKDANERRRFLSRASMKELVGRPEFKLKVGESQQSFEQLARKWLKSELAVQLIANGFIDQNFTLYTSTFYSDYVTANAMNFLLKNVDLNAADLYYRLTDDEAASVIKERGQSVLNEDAAYNVNMLDHLLANDPILAEAMTVRLLRGGEPERELLRAYLEAGDDKAALVRKLSGRWAPIFDFLVNDAELNADALDELIDVALGSAASNITYEFDESTSTYFGEAFARLSVFTSPQTEDSVAKNLSRLAGLAGVSLSSLLPLSVPVRAEFVRTGGYALTRDNLQTALGGDPQGLALDQVLDANEDVFRRTMNDLPTYLDLLVEGETTIAGQDSFDSILEDVFAGNKDQLDAVISRSAAECQILELSEVTEGIWTPAVGAHRVVMDFTNVSSYIEKYGIDAALGSALTHAGRITTPTETPEADKAELATQIINNVEYLPSPKLRAELVSTMALKQHLPATAIPVEKGELVGRLLIEDVIEDNAETFSRLVVDDVEGRVFAISRSGRFTSFMTPTEVPIRSVRPILASESISEDVKTALASRFTEFTQGANSTTLTELAKYAGSKGLGLTIAEVDRLADEKVAPAVVLLLLQPHLGAASEAELGSVLRGLGGEYAKLATRNGTRPRIPATEASRALADRLVQLQMANSIDERGSDLRINMKRPA